MKKQLVYKVTADYSTNVYGFGNRGFSITPNTPCSINHGKKISYHIDKLIQPPIEGSALFVFKDVQRAIDYANKLHQTRRIETFRVWEAETPSCRKLRNKFVPTGRWDMRSFWAETWIKHRRGLGSQAVPAGTYLCNELTIKKEIKF